ncbi:ras-related protein rab7 isoform X2 [Scleropages formosus]|uniref:ras-related protein rab7 isoform X2 n=1 Tax=Scleropages formosus TaxID=113540 RepID=UPI000878498D|nr:ras-related protein rab7-like isoform X2 [Scleropages formosus]
MSEWNKKQLKVVLLGNSGMYRATIGADFSTKEITVDSTLVILQIWDTAGTERFQSLGNALYRGAHCCLLLFDVTSGASFSALSGWLQEFLLQADPPDPASFPFVVVGNKTDLENREVSCRQAIEWCQEVGAEYFDGSAKDDINVDKPFYAAAKAALQHYKKHTEETTGSIQMISKETEERPKDRCAC